MEERGRRRQMFILIVDHKKLVQLARYGVSLPWVGWESVEERRKEKSFSFSPGSGKISKDYFFIHRDICTPALRVDVQYLLLRVRSNFHYLRLANARLLHIFIYL